MRRLVCIVSFAVMGCDKEALMDGPNSQDLLSAADERSPDESSTPVDFAQIFDAARDSRDHASAQDDAGVPDLLRLDTATVADLSEFPDGRSPPDMAASMDDALAVDAVGVTDQGWTGDLARPADGSLPPSYCQRPDGSMPLTLSLSGPVKSPTPYRVGFPIVVDLDGDQRPDVVASSYRTQAVDSLTIGLGNGDGTFRVTEYSIAAYLGDPNVGDTNGDGILDVVVSSAAGDVYVLFGRGDGSFQQPLVSPLLGRNFGVVLSDFNGDHILDIVAGGDPVLVALGRGDGSFHVPSAILHGRMVQGQGGMWFGPSPFGVVVADANRDGVPDVLASDGEGGVFVVLGKGDGTFDAPVYTGPYAFLQAPDPFAVLSSFLAADFNGDGKVDFGALAPDDLVLLFGDGQGGFPIGAVGNVHVGGPFNVGDLNLDGALDVIGSTNLELGNGDGTFRNPTLFWPLAGCKGVLFNINVADVDGDCRPDIVVGCWEDPGSINVLFNKSY